MSIHPTDLVANRSHEPLLLDSERQPCEVWTRVMG